MSDAFLMDARIFRAGFTGVTASSNCMHCSAGSKQLAEVRRGGKAGGNYFPINACQVLDMDVKCLASPHALFAMSALPLVETVLTSTRFEG